MTYRASTSANHFPSFVVEIAKHGLRRALRPFLRPSSPPFVAALVLPPGTAPYVYVDAANELFEPRGDYEIHDRFSVTVIDNAKGDDLERKFRVATNLERTLIFLTEQCDLPTDFALAVDHFGVIAPPTADHVIVAGRTLGLGEIGRADAELLASTPSFRLRSAMTVGRPIAAVIRRLRCVKAEPPRDERRTTPPRDMSALENLVGYDEVKAWVADVARDVEDWKGGRLSWSEIDRGAVLVGPPGTGKTKLAGAAAAACGMNLISTSAARWQAKGHLGDFLAAMRADFKSAAERTPCLLHLEELDSLGDRDSDRSDNAQYTRKAINGVLEAIDETFAKEGVVILGSTNNVEVIDRALLRSGRIERVFRVGLPSSEERLAILARHLWPHQVELPMPYIRTVSGGMSGADLEKVAREAKRRARAERRALTSQDIVRCFPAVRVYSNAEQRRTAVHEAGHAVVGLSVLPWRLVGVSISAVDVVGRAVQSLGRTTFERSSTTARTAIQYRGEIAMLLGGIAAEEQVFDSYTDGAGGLPDSDLTLATDIATMLECQHGMGETLVSEAGGAAFLREIRMQRPEVRERVDAVLRDEFKRASDIIWRTRQGLDDLVDAIMEHKVLSLRNQQPFVVVEATSIHR